MKFETKNLMKYAAQGVGAVAMPVIAGKISFLSGILGNAALAYSVMGVTVGSVLLAAVGVGLVDYLMSN